MTGNKIVLLVVFPIMVAIAVSATAQQSVFDHPDVVRLDHYGEETLVSRLPISANRTCGACHDVDVLAGHSDHMRFRLDTSPGASSATLSIVAPSSDHCAQCHGLPAASVNIHSGLQIECSDCHFANDDAAAQDSTQHHLDGAVIRCEDCHDTRESHKWLPYKNRHMDRVICEACHIPRAVGRATHVIDQTVLTLAGAPRVECDSIAAEAESSAAPAGGRRPVLLPRKGLGYALDALAPHNLITSWHWVHGEPPRPVPLENLKTALIAGGAYREDILDALDSNGDGAVSEAELVLDSPAKVAAVRGRLESLGLSDPRITGEVRSYGLHHGVVAAEEATRDCTRCHSKSSDAARDFVMAPAVPGGAIPSPTVGTNTAMEGEISIDDGRLVYTPVTMKGGFYLLGHDRWRAIDAAGAAIVLAVLVAAAVHGGIRFILWRSRRSRT